MPFDPSGFFNRERKWEEDAANGVKIRADFHDDEDDGFAQGLSDTITRHGWSTIAANIPWSGKRITNLGDPVDPGDAANLKSVNSLRNFSTSITLTGADLNGRIIFGPTATGVTGLSWQSGIDLSWLGKPAEASKTQNRLVLNDSGLGSATVGTDVFVLDETGMAMSNIGQWAHNLSKDSGGQWRTISPGIGSLIDYRSGVFNLYSNDTATITNPYSPAAIREFFTVANGNGSCFLTLTKVSGATGKYNRLAGNVGTELRWAMDLGNGTAESATRKGSDFGLYSYDNSGGGFVAEMAINRETHLVTFEGAVTSGGDVKSSQNFVSSTTNVVLATKAANGTVYLRPNGEASGTGSFQVDPQGDVTVASTGGVQAGLGIHTKAGSSGAYSVSNHANIEWRSPTIHMWIDNLDAGAIAWQSDYRIKKDIKPLPDMWDKVKSLKPISYSLKKWELIEEDDRERWGFVAHELQEQLTHEAASGYKDKPNAVQSPNPWVVIAALTKALQEAMSRIEALEAGLQDQPTEVPA